MVRPNPDGKLAAAAAAIATTMPPTRASQTLPSSPTHSSLSSSSSEFEFMTISISPRKSAASATADDLFYKGQLLPLHLSPRLSMVRSLLLSSSSTSSTLTASSRPSTSSSRPSTDSSSSSSRPSSATDTDNELKHLKSSSSSTSHLKKPNKYLSSLSRFSSVFRGKDNNNKVRAPENNLSASSVKRAKEVFRKYLKKVKPLYDKLSPLSSQKHHHQQQQKIPTNFSGELSLSLTSPLSFDGLVKERERDCHGSHSFSGNLLYPRKKAAASSCPSSMRSSPNHSGILYRNGMPAMMSCVRDSSSMEELQSAIQGAIAHCKKSMVENKIGMVSGEI